MENAENNADTTIVKVESSTNENNQAPPNQGHERQNNFRRGGRGGGPGERFGRGGRFGGPREGGGNRDGDSGPGRNFEPRRGGRGGGRGGRNMKQDNDGQDGDSENREGGGMRGGDMRGGDRRFGMRGPDDKFHERVQQLSGPTFDLPPIEMTEKKFNGRNRLYIGNIGNEVTEEDITELFKPYGETAEVFMNKEKNFGFVKVDYHSNAERAKRELDGTVLKSRNLKIRFAPNSATVKVRNLTPFVSNELLHYAFSLFGEIERAVVSVDERGKPTGEAIIDFARKGSALHAIRKCSEGCLFLTGALRPCIVELHELVDDLDGYPDKNVPKRNMEFQKEREQGPRFANPGSFEHEYGMRWKQLFDLHTQKEEALKKELDLEKEKLDAQMEYAKYEHETELLRDQLRVREMDKERQKREWEMKQRQVEEERLRTEEQMRRTQEEMEARMVAQQEDMRRRQQENSLFMQAHNLDSLLEQQEQAYDEPKPYSHNTTNTRDESETMVNRPSLDSCEKFNLITIFRLLIGKCLSGDYYHRKHEYWKISRGLGKVLRHDISRMSVQYKNIPRFQTQIGNEQNVGREILLMKQLDTRNSIDFWRSKQVHYKIMGEKILNMDLAQLNQNTLLFKKETVKLSSLPAGVPQKNTGAAIYLPPLKEIGSGKYSLARSLQANPTRQLVSN